VSTHILLIYPEVPETFWSFRHALKFIGKRAAFPPLGLLTVAAMLPAHWEKRLADLNLRSLSEEDLSWADVVMVGDQALPGGGVTRGGGRAIVHD